MEPDEPSIVDSTAALASLYQAPLSAFVARRGALVAQLRRSGHRDVADRIGGAAKPARAPFLVNQVYWRDRAAYDAVLEAGTAARVAQQARLLGDATAGLAGILEARDRAIAAAVSSAEAMAREDALSMSDALRGQVRATFEALAVHGLEGRLPHGHLTHEVELPGLAALAGLTLPHPAPDPVRRFEVVARRPVEPPVPVSPAQPDPRIVAAERDLETLVARAGEADRRVEELERALTAAEDVLSRAEAAAAEANRQAEQARQAVARGVEARDRARVAAGSAGRERDAAARRLRALRDSLPDRPSGDAGRDGSKGGPPQEPAPTGGRRSPARQRPRR